MAPTTAVQTALSTHVQQAVRFTDVYRAHRTSHPAIREAACLRAQFPGVLSDIEPDEMFAGGHVRERIVYHGSIWFATMPSKRGKGKQGGYCFDFSSGDTFARTDADREAIAELERFWSRECTWSQIEATWDDEMHAAGRNRAAVVGSGSGFVLAVQVGKLLKLGLPGLADRITERADRALSEGDLDALPFLEGCADTVDLIADVCRHYELQARALTPEASSGEDTIRLTRIADALAAVTVRPPKTLFEAIQLWWVYSVMTCGLHIEGWRLDVAFGDFFAADIDEGRLTEAQAIDMVAGLWRIIYKHSDHAVSRSIIGGKGRPNEANADRFCMAAMEVAHRLNQVIPQLTLRFYDGQNPALMQKAYDVIGDGGTYPMLYNDDVNIPGVAKALHTRGEDAQRYYPLGCGEYLIGGATPSLLCVGWSVPKTLEAALFGGRSACGARWFGTPRPTESGAFDDLWKAVSTQIAFGASHAARVHEQNHAFYEDNSTFLLGSLLMDDCLERGRPIFDGGARYNGACIMGHGFTNAADGLTAIKRLVYDEGSVSLDEIRQALKDNFVGHEALRRRLLAQPAFGNDIPEADDMLKTLWQEISRLTDQAGRAVGLDFFTVSSVNPGGYFMGRECGATADGRRAGQPFAIGNAPTAGNDTCGITALLNSVSRADPANGGATTNVKLAKSMFSQNRPKLEALFSSYWKHGGMQATLTVVNQAELLDAMEHPEKYPNLLVRVGGWTARFIDLTEEIRRDVIARTMY